MPGDRCWLVANQVTIIDQPPDEVDVFAIAHRFVEAIHLIQHRRPHGDSCRRHIGNASARYDHRRVWTKVERRVVGFVASQHFAASLSPHPRCHHGDLRVFEVSQQCGHGCGIENDVGVDEDHNAGSSAAGQEVTPARVTGSSRSRVDGLDQQLGVVVVSDGGNPNIVGRCIVDNDDRRSRMGHPELSKQSPQPGNIVVYRDHKCGRQFLVRTLQRGVNNWVDDAGMQQSFSQR